MMVELDDFGFSASGVAPFPAYANVSSAPNSHYWFANPLHSAESGPLGAFEIWSWLHSALEVEWPIAPHVPTALRGFRHSVQLSQVRFAKALGVNRLNVERWESGGARPFRGHTLALMTLLRPLVADARSAGQFLGLAAAVVCPQLKRPTATYSGLDIEAFLVSKPDDHRDLSPALVEAFTYCEIMAPLDAGDNTSHAKYIPVVGAGAVDRRNTGWEVRVLAVADKVPESDRNLWLALGSRLGQD